MFNEIFQRKSHTHIHARARAHTHTHTHTEDSILDSCDIFPPVNAFSGKDAILRDSSGVCINIVVVVIVNDAVFLCNIHDDKTKMTSTTFYIPLAPLRRR